MRKFMVLLLCIMSLVFGMAEAVRAQVDEYEAISFYIDGTPAGSTGTDWLIGSSFSPDANMDVTELGFYLPSGGSEEVDHYVAIFSSSGACLISGSVTTRGSDPNFGYTDDLWYSTDYNFLAEGSTYYLLGDAGLEQYTVDVLVELTGSWSQNGITLINGISYNGLQASDNSIDAGIIYNESEVDFICGPNFKYVSAVPIPGAIWLLGSGLVGLVGLRRRCRKI